MKAALEKMKDTMNVDILDEETIGMTKRLVVIKISTKHINLWMRQLDMKRGEISKLAELMGFDDVKEEIKREKSLERWAKRCSHYFTRKSKRMLYEGIDNMFWSG